MRKRKSGSSDSADPVSVAPQLGTASKSQAGPDPRVALLETSYKEVLDATKHQDDKVGRLLTATAFLTAASLALANLVGGQALPRQFAVNDEGLPPLALLALATFLVCVVFGVLLLVYSVGTPLKIPAFTQSPDQGKKPQEKKPQRSFSQIYFLPIAGASRDEWRAKWADSETERLQGELVDMYVNETHNLAVRTDFKYSRTNEGIAILAFGLLAFAASTVFVFAAATSPCSNAGSGGVCEDPVQLGAGPRLGLAMIVFGWTYATLLTQVRTSRLYVETLVGFLEVKRRRDWWAVTAGRYFALSLSVASAWFIVGPVDWTTWPGRVPYALLATGLVALAPTYMRRKETRAGVRYTAHTSFIGMGLGIVAAGGLAVRHDSNGRYAYALLASLAIPVAILLVTLVGPTANAAERRSKYRRSLRG